jgi:hypothetical protein
MYQYKAWFKERALETIKNCLKKQFLFLVWVMLFGIGGTNSLYCAELTSLYEAEVPVSLERGTPAVQQTKCLQEAFQEVLVKLTGSEKALKTEIVMKALENTDKYVKQFSYHQHLDAQRYMKVVFNENSVKELLALAKQPAWTKKRPLALGWLVVERESVPRWIGNDQEKTLTQEIEKTLNRRAIPLVLPLLDLTDTALISEKDVWDENVAALQEAAKRYNADVILVGRLSQAGDGWQGRWTLYKGETKESWEVKNTEMQEMLNESAEHLTIKLADYAFIEVTPAHSKNSQNSQTTRLLLTVSGILSAEQYNRVSEFLQRLPTVSEVEIAQITSEETVFSLKTTSEKEALSKLIAEEQLLIEVIPSDNTGNNTSNNTHDGNNNAATQMLTYKIAGTS